MFGKKKRQTAAEKKVADDLARLIEIRRQRSEALLDGDVAAAHDRAESRPTALQRAQDAEDARFGITGEQAASRAAGRAGEVRRDAELVTRGEDSIHDRIEEETRATVDDEAASIEENEEQLAAPEREFTAGEWLGEAEEEPDAETRGLAALLVGLPEEPEEPSPFNDRAAAPYRFNVEVSDDTTDGSDGTWRFHPLLPIRDDLIGGIFRVADARHTGRVIRVLAASSAEEYQVETVAHPNPERLGTRYTVSRKRLLNDGRRHFVRLDH